jgi:hypothetical protein
MAIGAAVERKKSSALSRRTFSPTANYPMVTWLGGSGELAWFNMATAGGARRWGTVSFDKDRLSHWCAIPLVVWTAGTFFLYIPFFHFLLGVSLVKVAVCSGLGCAGHLIVTPLLFSGRATAQNPSGDIIQTATAVIVWLSLSVLLIFYYLQRDWPAIPMQTLFVLAHTASRLSLPLVLSLQFVCSRTVLEVRSR